MPLHSKEIARIAKVLARFFPDFDQRQSLASKAEVAAQAQIAGEVVEAWRDIVHCAQVEGTLDVLLRAAVSERPNERDLRKLLEALEGEVKSETPRYLLVAVGLLAAGGAAFWLSDGSDDSPSQSVVEGTANLAGNEMATHAVRPPEKEADGMLEQSPKEMAVLESSAEDAAFVSIDFMFA